jgi:flagellar basal-body rod protein FlgB
MDGLFSKTIDLLSGMLDFRAARHKVIVSNIANMETPGFKPSSLDFKGNLDEIMHQSEAVNLTTTHPRHIKIENESSRDFKVSLSSEKVEIDKEMANLAENNILYNMDVELLARKLRGLNTVLKETK